MTVIRGEIVQKSVLLTSTGELLSSNDETCADLMEDECHQAFQQGVQKGETMSRYQALEEIKPFLELLQTMARKILEQKNRLLDQLKPEIIEFSLAVCERILRRELAQPHTLARLINSLLALAAPTLKQEIIHIVLSPEDFAMLEHNFQEIHYDKQEMMEMRFVSDPLMRRGDCRIEAKSGLLNYDIARELSDLQAKVLQK